MRSILNIAHRGYTKKFPDNTLESCQAAIDLGVDAIEFDVHETVDHSFVVFHDDKLQGKHVARLPLCDIQDVKLRECKIPTLEETLALTKGRMRLVIEIKQAGIAQAVVDVLRKTEALSDVTIISFSAETCRQVRELEPSLPVGWLTGGCKEDDTDEADTIIRTALAANCQFIDVAWPGIKPALLNRAQLAGMAIWAWTVDDPAAMHKLAELGVASITTNDVEAGMGAFAPEE